VDTTGVSGTAIPAARDARECAPGGPADLTWLLHRAAQRMRAALDAVAREHGLAGARDWLVLSAIADGPRQTQLALARTLGLDKTTLTSLLDRLEASGLVTRAADNRDRRARIPVLTPSGLETHRCVALARDTAESASLCGFSAAERDLLRDLLGHLAGDPDEPDGPGRGTKTSGSCI
jgi:DNA-binding MarR family transcriptional regulator